MGNSSRITESELAPGDGPPPSYTCPSCGYELRGLPPICTCPECGFECDPDALVIKLSPRRWHLTYVVIGLLFLAAAALTGRPANAPMKDDLEFWAFIGGLTLFYFLAFCWRAGEPSRLLLTRRGIRFEDRKLDQGWTEWSQVKRATYSWFSQHLYRLFLISRKFQVTK